MSKKELHIYNCDVCKQKNIEPIDTLQIILDDKKKYFPDTIDISVELDMANVWIKNPAHLCMKCFLKYLNRWVAKQEDELQSQDTASSTRNMVFKTKSKGVHFSLDDSGDLRRRAVCPETNLHIKKEIK